jgi:hypothetical protein
MTPDQITELAMSAKGMLDNPATRMQALALHKQNRPDVIIPELDLPVQFNTALAEERSKREAIEQRMIEADVRRDIEGKRAAMVAKGVPADKVHEVEAMMLENSIGSHEYAAKAYLMQQKMAVPTAPDLANRYRGQSMPAIDTKEFGGSVKNWAKAQAMQVYQGFQR